jgi:hypothetical protein
MADEAPFAVEQAFSVWRTPDGCHCSDVCDHLVPTLWSPPWCRLFEADLATKHGEDAPTICEACAATKGILGGM